MTQRQINNFIRKYGDSMGYHLFIIRPNDKPEDQYQGYENQKPLREILEPLRTNPGIANLQSIGNGIYVTLTA